MSANKRLKTEFSAPSKLRAECKTNSITSGSERLYTFVSSTQKNSKDSISSIYPILPNVGWSLVKEAFKFDSSKEVCYHFAFSKDNQDVGGTSQGFRIPVNNESTSLQLFAPDTKSRAECLRLAFFLPKDLQNEVMGLTHVSHVLQLTMELVSGAGHKQDLEWNLSPGVTSNFATEASAGSAKISRYIVYHGVLDKTNPQWSRELEEFLWCANGGQLPTIQIKATKIFSIVPKGFELDPLTVLTPFTLLDKERKSHPCHKEVLADQCPFFLKNLVGNPAATELIVFGNYTTVELLLHHFYHPLKPFPPFPTIEVAFEVVKLAHQLELTKLLAAGVDSLIEKLEHVVASSILRELYVFIHQLKFKVEIFIKLWKALLVKIHSRIVEEGEIDGFDDSSRFLNFKSFTKDGYFLLELTEELCRDLMKSNDSESPEEVAQHLKVQIIINRFKGDVIKRMGFKLLTKKIRLT